MSFKAVFEIFLQIHEFWNVDLPCQGLFQLRTSIYQQQEKQIIYATPFQFINPKAFQPSKKICQASSIQPPYFYSKGGVIKYSDQSLLFNDEVRFKLEIESFPRLHSQKIYVQFQLIFKQLEYTSSQIITQSCSVVQKKKFRLDTLEHGICNYCQAQFIGNYSSKVSFTLFACLSNFQFGKYRLRNQIDAVGVEGEDGKIKIDVSKAGENIRTKELERSKVKNFDQFMVWVSKYYKDRIPNPLVYFYNTYVKNLRYYFYLSQQKLDEKSLIKQVKQLKVPKNYIDLPASGTSLQTQVSQKQFKKYISSYQPQDPTSTKLLQQINIIYSDIYMFLMEVQKQMTLGQLMRGKMLKEYQSYIKDRYGQRVFRNIVRGTPSKSGSRENKKIAKKMRQKEQLSTVMYPIEELTFIQSKKTMQYLFYQITYPKQMTQDMRQKSIGGEKQGNKSGDEVNKVENILQNLDVDSKNEKQTNTCENIPDKNKLVINEQTSQILQSQPEQKQSQEKQEQSQTKKSELSNKSVNNITQNKNKQQNNEQLGQLMKICHSQNLKTLSEQILYLREQEKTEQRKIQQNNLNVFENQSGEGEDIQDDPYANITYQKGSVDSQMTEKSFEKQCKIYQNLDEHFQGISDIQIKQPHSGKQSIPPLNYNENNMLIVLCHGFQGSSYDMTLILRGLKQVLPNAFFLLAKSNQGQTEGDIQEMGKRLSEEVENYVRNYMDKESVILNFVGHSMGGIVARAGVKYLMKDYWNQFGFFCSLSSPHLGYLNGVDGMIKAGLWAILKFKAMKSLHQLKMDDEKDLRKSFLHNLSRQGHLKRFRKIILFSSFEDSYVSWHSARISAHSNKNSKFTNLQEEMVKNILGESPIHRIDVNFNIQTKNLDSFIGRTAHINLIIQQSLFKIINTTIPDLFDIRKL